MEQLVLYWRITKAAREFAAGNHRRGRLMGITLGISIGAMQAAGEPVVIAPVISGTFTEVGDTYDLTTTAVANGNWHWARTATGVTLSADGTGGWTGGTVLASGTQAVGEDSTSTEFDAGGTDGASYALHVYQRTAAGVDSNVIATEYVKDGPPASVAPSIASTAHTSGSTGGSGLVCALPASPTLGNWQLLFAASDNIANFGIPSGWSEVSPGDTAPGSVLQCRAFAREITAGNVGETTVTILNSTFKIAHGLVHEVQDTSGPGQYEQGLFQTLPSGMTHSGHVITTIVDKSRLIEALVFRSNLGGTSATGDAYAATNCLMVWGQQEQAVAGLSTALTYGTAENESSFAGVLVEMLAVV